MGSAASIEIRQDTDSLPIAAGLAKVCAPFINRFQPTHPHLAGARILTLDQLDAGRVATFFANHHSGYVDQRLAQLRSGGYDVSLSVAAVRDGEIVAGALFRSRPAEPSIFLDLILTLPAVRNGPAPLALSAHTAPIARARGYTHCVFEADARYDRFAAGFARRCGATPRWHRYPYSISRAEMELITSSFHPATIPSPDAPNA